MQKVMGAEARDRTMTVGKDSPKYK